MRGHHFSIFFIPCLLFISSFFPFFQAFILDKIDTTPRRILLHQPLFPATTLPSSLPLATPPPPSNPGFPDPDEPFYPEVPQGPSTSTQDQPQQPPPSVINGTAVTHPDPIQPQQTKPVKKVAIAVSVVIVTLGMLSALAFYICKHRAKHPDESQKLVGEISREEGGEESRLPTTTATSTFLYIGTVEPPSTRTTVSETNDFNGSPYRKLNSVKRNDRYRPSPDLQPLPPLTKPPPPTGISSTPPMTSSDDESHHENAFYTPQGSSLSNEEETYTLGSRHRNNSSNSFFNGSVPIPFSKRSSPPSRLSLSSSDIKPPIAPPSIKPLPPTRKKEFHIAQSVPYASRKPKFSKPPPPPDFAKLQQLNNHGDEISKPSSSLPTRSIPPPPPPPPPPPVSEPLKTDHIVSNSIKAGRLQSYSPDKHKDDRFEESNTDKSSTEKNGADDIDGSKPKLKSLHWDKVRTTSNRATVWDQLKSSSFQLNEDMMESLFGCDSINTVPKEAKKKSVMPTTKHENQVLDPKKSQNIAIMLRALNVTREEVSESLLDGNPEGLGQELLETLVKMAPTKEEEIKLRDYNGDTSRLGPAERFLKAILDVPFAFKRVEAMLYRANFDSEIKYLMTSFQTLEDASEELKNSRLFLKLIEAVLRAGNRMNVGTTRGDALAFKLDTLLKLADVKGTDGKTTLLHFVVQEIIRLEGSTNKPSSEINDQDFRKQGLQILGGLSKELKNVKKAATMDFDVLSSYVTKLEKGLEKVTTILQYEKPSMQSTAFFESMKKFVKEAEEKIQMVKTEEQRALSSVKEVTEYFHGDAAKEEAHPFRIFMIVRDFLTIVDNVCKEVGKMRDSSMVVGTTRSFRMPATTSLPVSNRYQVTHEGSSDEDSSS